LFAPADPGEAVSVLVELGVVDQRHRAVLEVLDGASVVEVARRYGVSRQSVHAWLRRYANDGVMALVDRSSRPDGCPHQMAPVLEAMVVGMRLAHPGWGPRTILSRLARDGVDPLPSRSGVYRALVRHGLVEVARRRRRREDYKRWERSRSMELWQMDLVGRFHLADGTELHALTGVDDHSRFCVSARLVARATARPVCDGLEAAFRAHGVPDQILTDNGKVFTARFGTGPGPTLFDRICAQNGVRHLLTAPRSPTTTGKIERFHKTWRAEFVARHDYQHHTVAEAQAALDAWVVAYNTVRPHQSLGDRPPVERFSLARQRIEPVDAETGEIGGRSPLGLVGPRPGGVTRWVDQAGRIRVAKHVYKVGRSFAGELVEVVASGGLVEIFHRQALIATHVQRGLATLDRPVREGPGAPRARRLASGPSVVRVADGNGSVSFAGTMYRAGRMWARQSITVTLVAGSVQLSVDGKVVRVHPARHDPAREHGAFATPKGRPRQPRTA
jgi:transposase InsO family protein